MDKQTEAKLIAIIERGPEVITETESKFLRARRSYLNKEQTALFADVLASVPEVAVEETPVAPDGEAPAVETPEAPVEPAPVAPEAPVVEEPAAVETITPELNEPGESETPTPEVPVEAPVADPYDPDAEVPVAA